MSGHIEDTPSQVLAGRVWNGTQWYYPSIMDMKEELKALRAENAALREAVRVLGEEISAAWKWDAAGVWERGETWDNATASAVRNNPIALAAVEKGANP